MTDRPVTASKPPRKTALLWFLNPFTFVAGGTALIIGLAAILVVALIGAVSNTHFDGLLDIHTGAPAPAWLFVAEGLIDWLSLSLALAVLGIIVARSRFRIVDLLGTQALARWPGLLVVTLLLISPLRNAFNKLVASVLKSSTSGAPSGIGAADVLVLGVVSLAVLLAVIWTVILMYHSYAVSCGVKGARAIVSFIVGLIAAEILSKFVLYRIVVHFGLLAAEA